MNEDAKASKAKADRLRETIESLTKPSTPEGEAPPPKDSESPHDFVQRRMREMREEEKKD